MIFRLPEWNSRLACSEIKNNFTNNSDRALAFAAGILMILLPFPFDNAGKSRTGKISIRPAEVRDTRSEADSESFSGFKTFAFSGKEIKAFPALLRAIKSSNLQIKPYPASDAINNSCFSGSIITCSIVAPAGNVSLPVRGSPCERAEGRLNGSKA